MISTPRIQKGTSVLLVPDVASAKELAKIIRNMTPQYNEHMHPVIALMSAKFEKIQGKAYVHLSRVETEILHDALHNENPS